MRPNSVAKTITEYVSDISKEADIRFDVETDNRLLDYVCSLNRPEGTLPGRININTATKEVIRAAIPPETTLWDANDLAADIVSYRNETEPYTHITDLLNVDS